MTSQLPGSVRPSTTLLAAEMPRALLELGTTAALRRLLAHLPVGDGHPVLVLPGFTADDNSTRLLRGWLREKGYQVHGWRLGINLGPTPRILEGLLQRLDGLRRLHSNQPISLVGWSLGGIYAREMARLAPDDVRGVVTLGSPYRIRDRQDSNSGALYNLLSTFHSPDVDSNRPPEEEREPLPVPSTSVYTRTDGVVPWRSCIEPAGPRSENIEVRGSHAGLGHNPAVLMVIADRLAQPAGTWQPFVAPRGATGLLFPTPVRL